MGWRDKEKANDVEDRARETIRPEHEREEKRLKTVQCPRTLRENSKRSDIYITGIPEEHEKDRAEEYLKKKRQKTSLDSQRWVKPKQDKPQKIQAQTPSQTSSTNWRQSQILTPARNAAPPAGTVRSLLPGQQHRGQSRGTVC